jgi:hypothetical protein
VVTVDTIHLWEEEVIMKQPKATKAKPVIATRKRTYDWIAYITEEPGKWEAGRTEVEAIGKLHISHPDLLGEIQRESNSL